MGPSARRCLRFACRTRQTVPARLPFREGKIESVRGGYSWGREDVNPGDPSVPSIFIGDRVIDGLSSCELSFSRGSRSFHTTYASGLLIFMDRRPAGCSAGLPFGRRHWYLCAWKHAPVGAIQRQSSQLRRRRARNNCVLGPAGGGRKQDPATTGVELPPVRGNELGAADAGCGHQPRERSKHRASRLPRRPSAWWTHSWQESAPLPAPGRAARYYNP